MRRVLWVVGIAVGAMIAFGPSCSERSESGGDGDPNPGGTTTASSTGSTTSGATDSSTYWGDGAVDRTCHACACTDKQTSAWPGCADLCDNAISGAGAADFCNGGTASTTCKECIALRCGVNDLTLCQ